MKTRFGGNAWIFGDHIDTDLIIPSRFLVTDCEPELGRHAFADLDPAFAVAVKPGDILVAGRNFGCGSAREHAPLAIRGAGIACIIAESYARTFFRNCVNRGFPVVELPGALSFIRRGDPVAVDLGKGLVQNLRDGKDYAFQPLPPFLLEIFRMGGLSQYIQARLDKMDDL